MKKAASAWDLPIARSLFVFMANVWNYLAFALPFDLPLPEGGEIF
jgi:hypothetical protein